MINNCGDELPDPYMLYGIQPHGVLEHCHRALIGPHHQGPVFGKLWLKYMNSADRRPGDIKKVVGAS